MLDLKIGFPDGHTFRRVSPGIPKWTVFQEIFHDLHGVWIDVHITRVGHFECFISIIDDLSIGFRPILNLL